MDIYIFAYLSAKDNEISFHKILAAGFAFIPLLAFMTFIVSFIVFCMAVVAVTFMAFMVVFFMEAMHFYKPWED